MFGMCNKEHKRCLFIVSKIDIIWSNRRTPEFINFQLWTSYKILFSLKYLLHFFGWLHFFISALKNKCMLLSWHVRISVEIYTLWLPECQGALWSKQVRHLNFKFKKLYGNIAIQTQLKQVLFAMLHAFRLWWK